MYRFAMFTSAVALAGCASDAGQMAIRHPIYRSYEVQKSERETTLCIQKAVPGVTAEVTPEGTVVSSKNQFGTSLISWYIKGVKTGSHVDVRRAQKIAPGIKKAESCLL